MGILHILNQFNDFGNSILKSIFDLDDTTGKEKSRQAVKGIIKPKIKQNKILNKKIIYNKKVFEILSHKKLKRNRRNDGIRKNRNG